MLLCEHRRSDLLSTALVSLQPQEKSMNSSVEFQSQTSPLSTEAFQKAMFTSSPESSVILG